MYAPSSGDISTKGQIIVDGLRFLFCFVFFRLSLFFNGGVQISLFPGCLDFSPPENPFPFSLVFALLSWCIIVRSCVLKQGAADQYQTTEVM